jgi:hypothetical protein
MVRDQILALMNVPVMLQWQWDSRLATTPFGPLRQSLLHAASDLGLGNPRSYSQALYQVPQTDHSKTSIIFDL